MVRLKIVVRVAVLAVLIAGCTMNAGSPATTTAVPTTVPSPVQTVPPTTTVELTTVPVTTTILTTAATTTPAEKEVRRETGVLTTKDYKTCDFKTQMGYKFLYPRDRFRITLTSDQPVLGYALSTERAGQLQGSWLIPRYVSYLKGGTDGV